MTSAKEHKTALRRQLRLLRSTLSPAERQALDKAVIDALLQYAERENPRMIAAYWPFDGEPDLLPALQELSGRGTIIALPVIHADAEQARFYFHRWQPGARMTDNRYGIPEPANSPRVSLPEIDLVLVPLVGWDQSGGRLGMGAGYYDRCLATSDANDSTVLAGVAYQLQKVNQVPVDPWDIRMQAIISEHGWFTCRS